MYCRWVSDLCPSTLLDSFQLPSTMTLREFDKDRGSAGSFGVFPLYFGFGFLYALYCMSGNRESVALSAMEILIL
jgi:hypothetical protein